MKVQCGGQSKRERMLRNQTKARRVISRFLPLTFLVGVKAWAVRGLVTLVTG